DAGHPSLGGLLTDSEEEDREGFTCAVCLDLYYCPYSCHPCGHVFCEPCLRTLARSRPGHTPCPLCRTLISHTLFQKDWSRGSVPPPLSVGHGARAPPRERGGTGPVGLGLPVGFSLFMFKNILKSPKKSTFLYLYLMVIYFIITIK
uniref:Ring finger protein 180b n=1 Tax=Gadus morhua TaxID=8049 RepID=A0A8C4Z7F4_GADMO